jgi:hypothetical protein
LFSSGTTSVEVIAMAFNLQQMSGILNRIKTPLTLAGLALLVFYGIFSKVLDLKVFSTLKEANTASLLSRVLSYAFVLALVCVVLGVASFLVTHWVRPRPAHKN